MARFRKVALGEALVFFLLALGAGLAASCTDLDSSEKKACATDADCLNGYTCVSQTCERETGDCATGDKLCDGECVSRLDPAYGCGQEGCAPCVAGGGSAVCDTLFRCRVDTCDPGFKQCDGACVPSDDPATGCGGTSCEPCPQDGGEAICTADGQCGYASCAAGTKLCNDQCVSLDAPEYGCAADSCTPCSIANSAGVECVAGECTVSGCKSGYKVCEDRNLCASFTDPNTGCGNVNTCAPCVLQNTRVAGCANDVCAPVECSPSYFANCDQRSDNGCEANTLSDVNNCGLCGYRCDASKANVATVKCTNAQCKVAACDVGFADCDGSLGANGCETNILTSSEHCGACAQACETGQTCVSGACI